MIDEDPQPSDMPDSSDLSPSPEAPQPGMVAVAYMGGLDDCTSVIDSLAEAGIEAQLNASDLIRPDLRARGYYLVTVDQDKLEPARAHVEKTFRKEFNLDTSDATTDELKCPACGALYAVNAASCPDCGLTFE